MSILRALSPTVQSMRVPAGGAGAGNDIYRQLDNYSHQVSAQQAHLENLKSQTAAVQLVSWIAAFLHRCTPAGCMQERLARGMPSSSEQRSAWSGFCT